MNRLQNLQQVAEQFFIERFFDVADILQDSFGIGGADEVCGNFFVRDGKLQRQLGEIGAMVFALLCCGGAFRLQHRRGGMPRRRSFVAQQTHRQRCGVEDRHAFRLEERQHIQQCHVVEAVVAIRLNLIHRHPHHDLAKYFQRQAGDANEPHFAGGLDFAQRRNRFVYNLVKVAELDVVNLNEMKSIWSRPSRCKLSSTIRLMRVAEKSKSATP